VSAIPVNEVLLQESNQLIEIKMLTSDFLKNIWFIVPISMGASAIGGGTGGPHGPRPPHFYFWGAWSPHLFA